MTNMNPQLQSSEALIEIQGRVLRVTEALYRTTDLFSDSEPLKWSLRESAIKILQTLSALDQHASFEDFREAQRVEKNIRGILVKIGLAASGLFMAGKNFEVLEREYIALRDTLERMSLGERTSLPIGNNDYIKSQDRQTVAIGDKTRLREAKRAQMPETVKPIKPMSERKDIILRFIQEKGPQSIGDVARSLNAGISEKTIQRDLNGLVGAGLLKKEGEKRWRRYFF